MTLKLFVSQTCSTCAKVERDLRRVTGNISKVDIEIYDIEKSPSPKALIVPALFIENELYCYGEFDSQKLFNYLNQ